jgi:hypothetical protein
MAFASGTTTAAVSGLFATYPGVRLYQHHLDQRRQHMVSSRLALETVAHRIVNKLSKAARVDRHPLPVHCAAFLVR